MDGNFQKKKKKLTEKHKKIKKGEKMKQRKKVNWLRIIAVFLNTFCTTFAGIFAVNGFFQMLEIKVNLNISWLSIIGLAFFVAFIHGLQAIAQELLNIKDNNKEYKDNNKKSKCGNSFKNFNFLVV